MAFAPPSQQFYASDDVGDIPQVLNSQSATEIVNPRGSVPTQLRDRISGWGDAMNLSTVTTSISQIQGAIRQAERGDTYQLFTLYRDWTLGSTHIQGEMAKRKMVISGQEYTIQPHDKENEADVKACDYVKDMIEDCENWDQAMGQLMDAAIWPVSVMEKIFDPEPDNTNRKRPVRFSLKKLVAVQPVLLCYKIPYLSPGGNGFMQYPAPNGIPTGFARSGRTPGDTIFNVDDWEADLRFYSTFANGMIDRSYANVYKPDPMRHIVHHGTLLNTGIRDNYGGAFRSLAFWNFLDTQVRDWWARASERFGAPFTVVKTNAQDSNSVDFLNNALSTATKVFGLVIDKAAEVELMNVSQTDMATGYKLLHDVCCDEMSKIITGQTTGQSAQGSAKLGDGAGQGKKNDMQVRSDYQQFDKKIACNTLKRQLFRQYLAINGVPGNVNIVWGGLDEADATAFATRLKTMKDAGYEAHDDSMEHISEKSGMRFVKAPKEKPEIPGKVAVK